MISSQLKGSIPALVTPLTEDGSLDEKCFCSLIDRALSSGCEGVMILGSCGEGATVDRRTFEQAVAAAGETCEGRGLLIVSTGSVSVDRVKENIRCAEKWRADAVLNIPPMYFDETQQTIKEYFLRLAEFASVPTMIYNIPSVTKNRVEPSTLTELGAHENIAGMKDSSGDQIALQRVVQEMREEDFKVFVGRAPLICASLQTGAAGSMTPIPNLDPSLDLDIHRFLEAGQVQRAIDLQMKVAKITALFGYKRMPINVNLKGMMWGLGLCEPYTAGFDPVLEEEEARLLSEKYKEICLGR